MAYVSWEKINYHHSFPAMLVDCFKKGGSLADFCVQVGVGRSKLYQWLKQHPALDEAYVYARECAKSYSEEIIRANLENIHFDMKSYLASIKGRFRDLERETPPLEILTDSQSLVEASMNLIRASGRDDIDAQKIGAIATAISTACHTKEVDELVKQVAQLEKMMQDKEDKVLDTQAE